MDEFVRVNVVFELPAEVAQVAADVSHRIVQNRKALFVLDPHSLYPLSVHPHITVYNVEYPEQNLEKILKKVESIVQHTRPINFSYSHAGINDYGCVAVYLTLTS